MKIMHGDSSVYSAAVNLVQQFRNNVPLIEGHGNFGSIDGDSAAAMRYTEMKLSNFSKDTLFSELDVVDYIDNFDNTTKEPTTLTPMIPFNLLNGSSGIAVGIAANTPSFNLKELTDLMLLIIKNGSSGVTDEQVLKCIQGPDYPTGGIIEMTPSLQRGILNGSGRFDISAEWMTEDSGSYGRQNVILTSIPYGMSKAGAIEKLAVGFRNKEEYASNVSDIRDESDSDIRVVITLKKGVDPYKVMPGIIKKYFTNMQYFKNILIVDGEPKCLGVAENLKLFLDWKKDIQMKHLQLEYDKVSEKHGLLLALEKFIKGRKKYIPLVIESNLVEDDDSIRTVLRNDGFSVEESNFVLSQRIDSMNLMTLHLKIEDCRIRLDMLRDLMSNIDKVLINSIKSIQTKYKSSRKTTIKGGDLNGKGN
jgi:DNA gyrase subunit A